MIGTSVREYLFIRACIFFLHYIAPISIACSILFILIRRSTYTVPVLLELIAAAETAFYLLVYLPRRYLLQRSAVHPTTLSPDQRRRLFDLSHETVIDTEAYLSMWFKKAPLSEIKRENVKEFFCWALLNKGAWGPDDEEELDEYADKIDMQLRKKLEPGRGSAVPLKLTLDRVNMMHRSLIWYFCVSVVDTITFVYMLLHRFKFYRLRLSRAFTVFPFRPLTLLSPNVTPAKTVTYWYRPHNSKKRLPVLFIHGIGIGLYPYVNFLADLNRRDNQETHDGDVGIIALELMPVSFRITAEMPEKEQLIQEILSILQKHGWDKVVLVSHSYGSVVATHLLHNPETATIIDSLVFVDPVSFLLHLPDVAYNFTCRKPQRANEYQLYYFASMDMGVAHTLGRRFFWYENIIWKQDLETRRTSVALSGKDLIVNTQAVGRYLTAQENDDFGTEWQAREWKGEGLEVLWFDHADHAQVFDHKSDYRRLIEVVRTYALRRD